MLQRIEAGPRLSEAVIHNGILYSCGIVAVESVGDSVFAQTQDILGQIDALLAQAGSHKTKIIKAMIWMADISQFAEMNRVWDAWVVPGQTPARATVEARLAAPEYALEIMIEAAV